MYDSTGIYPGQCKFCYGTGMETLECGRCEGTGFSGNAMDLMDKDAALYEVRTSWEWSYGKD